MDRDKAYLTSIPAEAREKVTARYGDGQRKRAEYYIGQERVGIREFHDTGDLSGEWAFRNGVHHGTQYRWDEPGELLSCAPYANGVAHGTAFQWGKEGRLLGTYTMERGTGIDLWWEDWKEGSVNLAEVHYEREGHAHGFEWWLSVDGSLWWERHWQNGVEHGIERQWNAEDRLRRGYPRYYVHGERVTKRRYVKACTQDTTLPCSVRKTTLLSESFHRRSLSIFGQEVDSNEAHGKLRKSDREALSKPWLRGPTGWLSAIQP